MRHIETPIDITLIALNLISSLAEEHILHANPETVPRIAKLAREAIEHAEHEETIRRLEVALLDARAHRSKYRKRVTCTPPDGSTAGRCGFGALEQCAARSTEPASNPGRSP